MGPEFDKKWNYCVLKLCVKFWLVPWVFHTNKHSRYMHDCTVLWFVRRELHAQFGCMNLANGNYWWRRKERRDNDGGTNYSTAKCMIVWSNQDHTFVFVLSLLPFKLANASPENKVSLQFSLKINFSNFLYIIFCVNFKNLIVKFHILYILNMRIKFRLNWILITIRLINLFFIRNFRS